MARKDADLQKHTLHLKKGDWEKLASFFPNVPTSIVVRSLVSEKVLQLEAKLPAPTPLNTQVDL